MRALNDMRATLETTAAVTMALLGWFALALQLGLIVANATDSLTAVFNFFSYFTILTNILVAAVLTVPLLGSDAARLASASVRSATAVYIAIVGSVYVLVLQDLWNPQGWQALADVLLHKVVPVLYIAYWCAFVQKTSLGWRDIPRWQIYPLLYFVYAVARGWLTGWYAYPFIDVSQLGFARVLLNAAGLVAVFVLSSALVVGIGRAVAHQRRSRLLADTIG